MVVFGYIAFLFTFLMVHTFNNRTPLGPDTQKRLKRTRFIKTIHSMPCALYTCLLIFSDFVSLLDHQSHFFWTDFCSVCFCGVGEQT